MSVVGFDVGNLNGVISAARQGGIEVLANDYNYRVTPCVISLTSTQRFIGEAGRSQEITNVKNTVSQFKRLIGRKYNNPDAQRELARANYTHMELDDGSIGIQMNYMGEVKVFTPEQIYAMFLTKLKHVAEIALQKPVVDIVISCSNWFNDAQRRGIVAAAQIAGLNCVRLMNDTTAAALSYGIYKQELPEEEANARIVAFVDIGHSSMQVAICSFTKGKLVVKATAADQHLGGRDFDLVLYEHFRKEFLASSGVDINEKPRARVRMFQECEKIKKLMSANSSSIPLNIECLYEDHDFRGRMDRTTFMELASDLLSRVDAPLVQAMADAGITKEQLDSVEIIGGGTRVPAVKEIVVKVCGREPSTTLNADEAVSRGCALQAAILSPTFRVRDFQIKDSTAYAVDMIWKGVDGADSKAAVFTKNNEVPNTKLLTFKRAEDFEITALYNDAAQVPDSPEILNKFKITGVHADKDGNPSKFKVKVRVNPHGIIGIEGAHMIEEVIVEDDAKPMETDAKEAKEDIPMTDAEQNLGEKMDTDETPSPKGTKKITKKVELKVETLMEISQADIIKYQEFETQMENNDRFEVERLVAKNNVEEYVYDIRDKLEDKLRDFVSEADKVAFVSVLTKTEDWLYEEGEDELKKVYEEKLAELKKIGNPIVARSVDWVELPKAEETLRKTLVLMKKALTSYANGDEKYAHITKEEMAKVENEVKAKEEWINAKSCANAKLNKTQSPVVTAADILTERA
eukprot:Ihof_evm10s76 gene=Ihof_evmTU10s76